MNQTYKLVAFDMDGVIFENKNSWEMVHEVFKTSYNNEEIMKNPSKKKYDTVYKELIGELWKGKDTREINNKVQEAKYNPGVREVVASLKKRGYILAIISSGFSTLAKRAKEELGFDHVFAKELMTKEGIVSGEFNLQVYDYNKGEILQKLCEKLGFTSKEAIVVGDGANDIAKFKVAGISIAFNNPNEKLIPYATHVVTSNNMLEVLKHIP